MLSRTMPDLRAAVLAELKRTKWTPYRLIKELKGKRPDGSNVPDMTVRQFLRGETALNSDDLGLIFDVLGLKVKR